MARLALDLGTKTGWCLYPVPLVHGVENTKAGRFESHGVRFLNFLRMLDRLDAEYGIDEIVFEEVRRHMGTDAAHTYGGFMSQLQVWCERKGIPYRAIPVGTVKKAATGKGNASKDEVIAAVRALGYDVKDENEADAIAVSIADEKERGVR